jgi:hypothetical protein
MDLVTLFAACALGAGIRGAACCPAHPPVMGQVRSIDADGLPAAQSSTANSIGARPRATPDIDRWQEFITEASRRFAVPEFWIRAVMAAESAGQTMLEGRPITSPAGAMGLMQVIPETYAEMRLRHGLGADPYDPRDNILAGAAYLRAMYDRYGYPGFFAAYNVGPARFEGYLQHGVPLPEETLHYLMTIGPDVREAIVAQRPDVAAGLTARVARTVASMSENGLFFPLGTAFGTTTQAPLGPVDRRLPGSDSRRNSPVSSGLFVPLTSSRGTLIGAEEGP